MGLLVMKDIFATRFSLGKFVSVTNSYQSSQSRSLGNLQESYMGQISFTFQVMKKLMVIPLSQKFRCLHFHRSQEKVSFPNDPDGKKAKRFRNLCKGFTLGICYAANIGGICALTGTVPNVVLAGQLEM